jgi:hypothetical protein
MRVLFAIVAAASLIAATIAVPTLPDGESGKKARSGLRFFPSFGEIPEWSNGSNTTFFLDADTYFAKQDVITDVREMEHFVADHSDQVLNRCSDQVLSYDHLPRADMGDVRSVGARRAAL